MVCAGVCRRAGPVVERGLHRGTVHVGCNHSRDQRVAGAEGVDDRDRLGRTLDQVAVPCQSALAATGDDRRACTGGDRCFGLFNACSRSPRRRR